MRSRSLFLTAVTLSLASGAALAADISREQVQAELAAWQANPVTADGYRYVGGELGALYEGPRAAIGSGTGAMPITREQVRRDYAQFLENPVTADGYRFMGGDLGYEYEGLAR